MEVPLIFAEGLFVSLLATAYAFFRGREERRLHVRANNAWAGRLRLLEEHTAQAIFVLDRDGLIRRVNPAAELRFGYSEKEMSGHNIWHLMPEISLAHAAEGATEMVRKDGSRVQVRYKTAKAPEQEIYVFFAAEPPEKNRASREQPQQTRTLAIAERVVSRIVRQLEGPLTTISGYTELALGETPEDNPARKALEEIAVASDTASRIALHLLAFTGGRLIPAEFADLNAIVEGLQQYFAAIQIELCAERLLVFANSECLLQIILILCGSVHQRLEQETAIQIVNRRRKLGSIDYASVSISDRSRVLAPSTVACLFEPFFLDGQELGVELSAIYGMARNLGGMLNVTSEEDRGTTFEILIPLAPGEQQDGQDRAAMVQDHPERHFSRPSGKVA